MADKIKLGGRTFEALSNGATVRHDLWLMGHVSRAGLADVQCADGESPDSFCRRVLDTAVLSGSVLEMLGALILPEGMEAQEWTPETALETAQFIGGLTGEEDKAQVRMLILSLLFDFFRIGLASVAASRTYSAGGQTAPHSGSPTTHSESGAPLPEASQEPITTS